MLEDPLRYILTTTDGAMENYSGLPSNVPNTGECTYENLALASAQLSGAQLTMDRNGTGGGQSSPAGDGYVSGERNDLTDAFNRVSFCKLWFYSACLQTGNYVIRICIPSCIYNSTQLLLVTIC